MARVRLIHWNDKEGAGYVADLEAMGFHGEYSGVNGMVTLQQMRATPPDAVVIHLGRLPSHGRELAMSIRSSKTLREIPIVFADGDPVKVDAIRAKLPDATYTSWKKIKGTL